MAGLKVKSNLDFSVSPKTNAAFSPLVHGFHCSDKQQKFHQWNWLFQSLIFSSLGMGMEPQYFFGEVFMEHIKNLYQNLAFLACSDL